MITYLQLRQLGFSLFPLGIRLKRPDTTKGVLPREKGAATWRPFMIKHASEEQLHTWFKSNNELPARNIGLILGAISGFVCIDTDTEQAEEWVDANLPKTPMMTRCARGFHRFYRHPLHFEVPAFIRLADMSIEIRRDGQYVVGPGSTHPSGHIYTEVETWPLDPSTVPELPESILLYKDAPGQPRRASDPIERPDFITDSNKGREHLTLADTVTSFEVPDVIQQSERHATLFKLVRSLKLKGVPLDEAVQLCLDVNEKSCSPPLPREEVARHLTRSYRQRDIISFEVIETTQQVLDEAVEVTEQLEIIEDSDYSFTEEVDE